MWFAVSVTMFFFLTYVLSNFLKLIICKKIILLNLSLKILSYIIMLLEHLNVKLQKVTVKSYLRYCDKLKTQLKKHGESIIHYFP